MLTVYVDTTHVSHEGRATSHKQRKASKTNRSKAKQSNDERDPRGAHLDIQNSSKDPNEIQQARHPLSVEPPCGITQRRSICRPYIIFSLSLSPSLSVVLVDTAEEGTLCNLTANGSVLSALTRKSACHFRCEIKGSRRCWATKTASAKTKYSHARRSSADIRPLVCFSESTTPDTILTIMAMGSWSATCEKAIPNANADWLIDGP